MTQVALSIEAEDQGVRLDQLLAQKLPSFSRARVQKWIKSGLVLVNDLERPANYRVRVGDQLICVIPEVQPWHLTPESIPLDILYEDDDLVVLNKPPGLTVHPGAGQSNGTLVNALLHHCPNLEGIGDVQRPGLVHRLDKDTSGVMVVAKTEMAHQFFLKQFKDRHVDKRYLALVWGRMTESQGEIKTQIGRHPTQRHKMAVTTRRAREASTSWRRLQEYPGPLSLLELTLHTGRTHQIRVHLSSMGHPVVGDKTYGGGEKRLLTLAPETSQLGSMVCRQLLHAWKLRFRHPRRDEELTLSAPLPEDFQAVLDFLADRTHD
jgi:23S rRNA pseudouridine1911/1915/1917 synthase